MRRRAVALAGVGLVCVSALAQDGGPSAADAVFTVNNLWVLIATALVFIMHLGFATIEVGLTRAKNTVNILFKNTAIVAIGLLSFTVVGFNLMYPEDPAGHGWLIENWLASPALGISNPENGDTAAYNPGFTFHTNFIFQAMFAATAATIVSGAVAERIRLGPFLVFSVVYVTLVYPIVGSWKWGLGWLHELGFYDFAGSTLVHTVGGWGALAGVIVVGPRLGKYVKGQGGKTVLRPILGHSMPLATVGCLLLWFGWFGFNGGSVLSADPAKVSLVFVTTSLAGAAGMIGAIITSWMIQKKPDLSMALNGCLAGLVGITAGADTISVNLSLAVGAIAGVLVVASVILLDRLRLDDPVGAVSVHLVCGTWGTLAVGIFSSSPDHTLLRQAIGVLAVGAACFPFALGLFAALRSTVGLRVGRDEEMGGLDVGEHGMEAYGGFQVFPE